MWQWLTSVYLWIADIQPRTDMINNQKLLLFSCWPSLFLIVTSIQEIIIYNIIINIIIIDTMPSMDSLHYYSLLILSLVHLPIHLHVWHTCMPSMDFFIIIHVWHSCMPSMSVSRPGANSLLSQICPEFDYLDSYHLLKEELLEDLQPPRGSSSSSSFSKW